MNNSSIFKNAGFKPVLGFPFRKKFAFYTSVGCFLMLAFVYLQFAYSGYKVSYEITVNKQGLAADSLLDSLTSKSLVRATVEQLPLYVSYYLKSSPQKEIYGNSLPVRIITGDPGKRVYRHDLLLSALSSHSYRIEHEDTIQFYELDQPVKNYYGKFTVVKGPTFSPHFNSVIARLHGSADLISSYRAGLSTDVSEDGKTIVLSVLSGNPQKGKDFLRKLVMLFNNGATPSVQKPNYRDSLQFVKAELTALQKPIRKQGSSAKLSTQQVETLDAIRPYLRKPVSQFVQVPYTDEVQDQQLKNDLEEYNAIQLSKQHTLGKAKIDDLAVLAADKRLNGLKAEINDYLDQPADRHILSGGKIISKQQLQLAALRYMKLIIAGINNSPAPGTGSITLLEIPGPRIEKTGPNVFAVYTLALLSGLLVPLAFIFCNNLNIPEKKGAWFNSQTLAEKIKIMFGLRQID